MSKRAFQAVLVSLATVACWAGCGAGEAPTQLPLPSRQQTAGESLLALAPLGADLLVEIDLERLRANSIVGSLLSKVAPPTEHETADLLQRADAALVCVYGIGDSARQLVIMRSSSDEMPGARSIGKGLFAVGDPKLLAQVEGLQSPEHSMARNFELLRLRAEVMPEAAQSATLRVAGRLDFDARVAIAAKVNISDVPVAFAVWGDVVDDLAIVLHLRTENQEGQPRLLRAVDGLKKTLARNAFANYLGLATPLREARVTRSELGLQVVFLLGPRRLNYVVDRLLGHLAKSKL